MTKAAKLLIAGQTGALLLSLLTAANFAPANAADTSTRWVATSEVVTEEPVVEESPSPEPTPTVTAPVRPLNYKRIFSSRSRADINQARELAPKDYRGYFRTAKYAKWYAARHFKHTYGWGKKQFKCAVALWHKESSWRPSAGKTKGRYVGIPQLDRMIVVASGYSVAEYIASTELQIQLGAKYIKLRKGYGSPCKAWKHFQRKRWY